MKRIGLVFLALVVALGSLGAAYAMWKDEVFVKGVVSTGEVKIEIVGQRVLDDDSPFPGIPPNLNGTPDYLSMPHDYTCNDGFTGTPAFWVMGTKPGEIGKNVSWGECAFVGDTMTVILHETYPSNFNEIGFYATNTGTVPVKISKTYVFLGGKPAPGATPYAELTYAGENLGLDFSSPPDGIYELEIHYGDNFNAQIEPGMGAPEFSYWVHTLQQAEQNHDYVFTLVVVAVNYNE